ncbi:MAG: hypothetical protein K1000chlam4_00908 [Chlamydiae bacterium]|nr:hypothetical protein [Chlamydiota bacterium]
MTSFALSMAGSMVKSQFSDRVSTQPPHWTFYVGVSATSAALLAAATATVAMAVLAMTTQAITVGACGGLICGAMFLMTAYLYLFSRDHNIVKAGLAQAEALRRAHEVTEGLEGLIEAEKDLIERLKNPEFAKDYVAATRDLRSMADELVKALNEHKKAQATSLEKARKYTKDVAKELGKHDAVLTATNRKQQALLGKIDTYESKREETNLSLRDILEAKEKGLDLLEGVRSDLEEGVKCLRRYAKLAETIQTDNIEQRRNIAELQQLLEDTKAENAKQKAAYEKLVPLLEKLNKGKGGDS